MNTYKCFQCLKKDHAFRDCSKPTCSCMCVNELFALPRNEQLDAISDAVPGFLRIRCDEIPNLLYPYKQMKRFMRIRESEQVIGKPADKRLKEASH